MYDLMAERCLLSKQAWDKYIAAEIELNRSVFFDESLPKKFNQLARLAPVGIRSGENSFAMLLRYHLW